MSVTFVSRREPADLAYPWAQLGSDAADDALGKAELVVLATSAAEGVGGIAQGKRL